MKYLNALYPSFFIFMGSSLMAFGSPFNAYVNFIIICALAYITYRVSSLNMKYSLIANFVALLLTGILMAVFAYTFEPTGQGLVAVVFNLIFQIIIGGLALIAIYGAYQNFKKLRALMKTA